MKKVIICLGVILSFIACQTGNIEEDVVNKKKSIPAFIPTIEELATSISPEENADFLTLGICNVIEENVTLGAFANNYNSVVHTENMTVPHEVFTEVCSNCMTAYEHAHSNISDINDEDELIEYLRAYTEEMFSDAFYTTLVELIEATRAEINLSIDYSQFSDEEAYAMSNAVAICNSITYVASVFTNVADTYSTESDCWDDFVTDLSIEIGYAAAGAVASGILAAGVAFVSGSGVVLLLIASTMSTVLNTTQLYRSVKAIYLRYANCLELEDSMIDNGIIVGDYSDEDSYEDIVDYSEYGTWERFLDCHIIREVTFYRQFHEYTPQIIML